MLCTIDPKVGGVLLSGARGTAKSTIARALLDLMPSVDDTRNHFVTLPLGASEERITGTLDLEKCWPMAALRLHRACCTRHTRAFYTSMKSTCSPTTWSTYCSTWRHRGQYR